MRPLLFLTRLAFICNVCFALAFSIQLCDWLSNGDLSSTIFVLGYFLALVLNPLANLCYLAALLLRKKPGSFVPRWLSIANLVFLFLQIAYILFFHDQQPA